MPPILYLAPLHGVTNSVFRNVYCRNFTGIDYVMAPFISCVFSETIYAKGRANHFKDLLPVHNSHLVPIPQVLANHAPSFIETVKIIEELGYSEVNLNMGCPFPMVTNKKRGSGILPHPDLIRQFLDEVCAKIDIDISLKVRLGLNDPAELMHLMPLFNDYPLKKIIIHPRTGKQMYNGVVDLDGFTEAADLSSHEIMYNGDIKDIATFEMLQKRFPKIKEWMIGRWAIYNPFLPSLLKGSVQVEDPLSTIRIFHDELYFAFSEILFGPTHILARMKEVWTYLGKSFMDADKALRNIKRTKTIEEYNRAVDSVFSQGRWLA